MTLLVNLHTEKFDPKTMLRIDRQTIYGNPFKIGKDGSRDEVIQKFNLYFLRRMANEVNYRDAVYHLLTEVRKGKRLACWCVPEACHGTCYLSMIPVHELATLEGKSNE